MNAETTRPGLEHATAAPRGMTIRREDPPRRARGGTAGLERWMLSLLREVEEAAAKPPEPVRGNVLLRDLAW